MKILATVVVATVAILAIRAPEVQSAQVTCFDQPEDYITNKFKVLPQHRLDRNDTVFCHDDSCIPVSLKDASGEADNSTGFFVFRQRNSLNPAILTWNDTETEGAAYLYLRYYIKESQLDGGDRPPTAYFSHEYCHGQFGTRSCHLETDKTENHTWKEICIKADPGIAAQPTRFVYFDYWNSKNFDFMAIDKLIYVRLEPGETELRCSRSEIEDIKQYCGANPPTAPPPIATSTPQPPSSTATDAPAPPPELPWVTCIDHLVDLQQNDWVVFSDQADYNDTWWRYCDDPSLCYDSRLPASGVFILEPPSMRHVEIKWNDTGALLQGKAYLYVRYAITVCTVQPAPYGAAFSHDTCSQEGSQTCQFKIHDIWYEPKWVERCMEVKPDVMPQRTLQFFEYYSGRVMAIDKMIYVRLGPDDPQPRCSPTETQDIQKYCSVKPPSTTTTIVTSPPASSTSEMPTSAQPPSTTSEVPTSPPTTPAPSQQETMHWIDIEQDLQRFQWSSVGSTLRYADCSEPTAADSSTLVAASGIFVLEGHEDEEAQELVSPTMDKGLSYLYLRYYVSTLSTDAQQYYVYPVAGQFMGVKFLDTKTDSKWKEVTLELDSREPFEVRIGTSSKDAEDKLLIDKIILQHRSDDAESSCKADSYGFWG